MNPNVQNATGHTPLHWAAAFDKSGDVYRLLLDHKADPNLEDHENSKAIDVFRQSQSIGNRVKLGWSQSAPVSMCRRRWPGMPVDKFVAVAGFATGYVISTIGLRVFSAARFFSREP
jgi:hypothetical protein